MSSSASRRASSARRRSRRSRLASSSSSRRWRRRRCPSTSASWFRVTRSSRLRAMRGAFAGHKRGSDVGSGRDDDSEPNVHGTLTTARTGRAVKGTQTGDSLVRVCGQPPCARSTGMAFGRRCGVSLLLAVFGERTTCHRRRVLGACDICTTLRRGVLSDAIMNIAILRPLGLSLAQA